jgi:tagatose-6-phosphate ketose/aldose isomerase
MQECHLKMLEMTDGIVAARFESFLGLRHGPQVFVNEDCAVVAALSSESRARNYELDMLEELGRKEQGCATMVICGQSDRRIDRLSASVVELFPEGEPVQDVHRVMIDVMVGQILGLFKSIRLGLKPDSPSRAGTIHRVVEGVKIYL